MAEKPYPIDSLEAHRNDLIKKFNEWYSDGSSYGALSQRLHGLQAAHQATLAGAPKEIVVGALLHDIGWKLSREKPSDESHSEDGLMPGGVDSIIHRAPEKDCIAEQLGILAHCEIPEGAGVEQQRAQHDVIGGTYLRMNGFDETCAHIVEGHVLAKRYLCYKEEDYYNKLSEGSKRTLEFQGGPMTADEASIFEKDPLFAACVEMRRWDEGAKEPSWAVPDLEHYESMIKECVWRLPTAPGECGGTYERKGNKIIGLLNDDEGRNKRARLWAPTIPTVPCLRSPRATELLAQWHEKGYVVLKRDEWLGSAACDKLSKDVWEVPKLQYDGQAANGPFHTWEVGSLEAKVPSRTEAFADHHEGLNAFLQGDDSPLKAVVSHLAGESARLYKEKVNYKAPGGGGYAQHQDGYQMLNVSQYKNAEDRGFIAYVCMVAVDASTRENGCPELGWKRWQKREGWLHRPAEETDSAEHSFEVNGIKQVFDDMGPYEPIEMEEGDLLIYDNFMPHKSGTNTTSTWRRALFGIYYGNESEPRDLRKLYYEREAEGRRKAGGRKHETGGKANQFHTGKPVLV